MKLIFKRPADSNAKQICPLSDYCLSELLTYTDVFQCVLKVKTYLFPKVSNGKEPSLSLGLKRKKLRYNKMVQIHFTLQE